MNKPEFGDSYEGLEAHVDYLRDRLSAVCRWLEINQPDVFSRGLWDAVEAAGGDPYRPLMATVCVNVRCNACNRSLVGVQCCDRTCDNHGGRCGLRPLLAAVTPWLPEAPYCDCGIEPPHSRGNHVGETPP